MDPFKSFAAKRIFLGILFLGVVLWVIGTILGSFEAPSSPTGTETATVADTRGDSAGHEPAAALIRAPGEVSGSHETPHLPATPEEKIVTAPGTPTAPHETAKAPEVSHSQSAKADHQTGDSASSKAAPHGVDTAAQEHDLAPERFWGWRPNDILNFTDNVNNFQLGVLEVTRRAVITLTERISRTGTTAALDPNLEDATNWLMLKADGYWFPSPESKYNEALDDLRKYKAKLEKGKASFYTRTDNLIPLLATLEDLLGSCDENLAKFEEKGGDPVSFFDADNYFYFAQGVASATGVLLEAIYEEYLRTLEARRATEILHHAIEWCHRATKINPWIITNSELDGILANHRANMAAPISHARFYLGVLIKTLST